MDIDAARFLLVQLPDAAGAEDCPSTELTGDAASNATAPKRPVVMGADFP